jgi:uncharacterized protein (DUF433 family)
MSKSVEIVKTPDVLGGKPRIEGERIGVHMIGAMVRRGDFHIEDVVSEDQVPARAVRAARMTDAEILALGTYERREYSLSVRATPSFNDPEEVADSAEELL